MDGDAFLEMARIARRRDVPDPNISVPGEETEGEADYVNAAAPTVDKPEATSDHKCCSFSQCFPPLMCWLILTGILLLRIYFISAISEKNKQMTIEKERLKTEINQLSSINSRPISENKNLKMNVEDLTEQLRNLNRSRSVLEDENTNLKAEKEKFTKKIKQLEENLRGQIQNMEAELIKSNTSRAQWSVDAYCPKENTPRTCKPCEKAWLHIKSRCYAVYNRQPVAQRSWEGAREVCRGKGSDLVVVADDDEKETVSDKSWGSSGSNGYWIGLRAENGKWKWLDGSDLANKSWMRAPPTDGRCVISVKREGWKSVRCNEKQQWICEKEALSV